jgi:hypothetical protein
VGEVFIRYTDTQLTEADSDPGLLAILVSNHSHLLVRQSRSHLNAYSVAGCVVDHNLRYLPGGDGFSTDVDSAWNNLGKITETTVHECWPFILGAVLGANYFATKLIFAQAPTGGGTTPAQR